MPAGGASGYSIAVKHELLLCLATLATWTVCACGGKGTAADETSPGSLAADDAAVADDAGYETTFQGDGVQCGAIVCTGSQQCCLVYVPTDASSSNPTHACDQDCVSVCADTCPDAGGMTSAGAPPMGGGMPPMGGATPPMGGGGMPSMGGGAPPMGGGMPPMEMGPVGAADAAAD